jgi:hypothetical protein
LVGDQAIMAWHIREGSWKGVPLDGLSVVGITKASATLGDPFANPYPAKAVLIVDNRANGEQRTALREFAQSRAQDLLKDIVRVEKAPIEMEIGEGEQHGCAKLSAGALVKIETRCIGGKDHLCGNELPWYRPLSKLSHSMPAFALAHDFRGQGLNAAAPGAPAAAAGTAAGGVKAEDVMSTLERLGEMKTKGILTQEEFDAKKAELLKKLV